MLRLREFPRALLRPHSRVSRPGPFSQERGCAWCGARYEIRVHFDRDCAEVRGGNHFHRLCRCGHRWHEQCSEDPFAA